MADSENNILIRFLLLQIISLKCQNKASYTLLKELAIQSVLEFEV